MKKKIKNELINELVIMLKILANKHRLRILELIKKKGEKSVGQIADHLEIPFNTASKNLLYLSKKGILARRYDEPFVLYKISVSFPKPINTIISSLL